MTPARVCSCVMHNSSHLRNARPRLALLLTLALTYTGPAGGKRLYFMTVYAALPSLTTKCICFEANYPRRPLCCSNIVRWPLLVTHKVGMKTAQAIKINMVGGKNLHGVNVASDLVASLYWSISLRVGITFPRKQNSITFVNSRVTNQPKLESRYDLNVLSLFMSILSVCLPVFSPHIISLYYLAR